MEQTLKGTIILGDEFEPVDGYITIENGIIKKIEESNVSTETIIAPCFVNAHTHIGDSVIKDPTRMPLAELVQPPDGLKHRILKETSHDDLVGAMRASIGDMIKTGTCAFADFREGGMAGVMALKEALNNSKIEAKVFGRPLVREMDYLDSCDGTGLSSTNDLEIDLIKDIARQTRKKEKNLQYMQVKENNLIFLMRLNLNPIS